MTTQIAVHKRKALLIRSHRTRLAVAAASTWPVYVGQLFLCPASFSLRIPIINQAIASIGPATYQHIDHRRAEDGYNRKGYGMWKWSVDSKKGSTAWADSQPFILKFFINLLEDQLYLLKIIPAYLKERILIFDVII